MCNEKVDNYPHSLQVVPERYKAQNMFGKTVITYSSTMKFVPKYFMTHKMCYKAANRFFLFDSVPDQCKTQRMCNRVLSEDPFLIKHTLIPLFLSDFWLDILNLKNAKNLNKMIREELMLIDGAIILPERWWNF